MKTTLPLSKTILSSFLIVLMTALGTFTQAQELQFKNVVLVPGSPAAGTDGATYRFPSVSSGVDALVKINGRSSSLVQLVNIDVTDAGFDKAFQPQVTYNNGSVSGNKNWWMEFQISFVQANTTIPAIVSSFDLTALDIDGDNNRLKEYVSLYGQTSYTLESNSLLGVNSILETVLSLLTTVGKEFTGAQADYSGIVTTATQLMTTNKYNNKNTFRIRTGATNASGTSTMTQRNYSMWFKSFTYSTPIVTTLPVKMYSFNANLNNNKVDLKWVTASEINVSHFVVEKSIDGVNYNDAGVVFAYGNATDKTSYSLSDNVNTANNGVIYYRLRSVDNDGKTELSETRLIRVGKQTEKSTSIVTYPNPVRNEIRVTIPAAWQNKKVVYEVYNAAGIVTNRKETTGSSQTETIDASSMAPGFYIVKVSFEGQVAQQKIIKQ